ncbi:MAG: transketolase family protein [Nanoarchaeota archaeon]
MGSIRNGFGTALEELGQKNRNVVALCADLTDSLKITKFKEKFPNRYFECGVAEQNMIGLAAGMATTLGKIPFVASYAAFNPGRNWDQLRVSVCYQNANVKILGGHAGLTTGPDGATHQALEDIAITRVLPNLTVIVPCDEEEMRKATIEATRHKGPVYLRASREKSPNITEKKTRFKIGKGNVLIDGKDIVIFACGITVQFALEAAKELEKKKVSCAVINMHTIKPIDEDLILKYAKKTGAFICVEEHQIAGGLGSVIAEVLIKNNPIPMEFVGIEDSFGESGEGYELLDKYGISTKKIIKKIEKVLKRK